VLRFLLNDSPVSETGIAADLTVLDYLRDQQNLCGTKEGCASGDCGACTAVVAWAEAGQLRYKSINTCITLLGSLHGQQLITVEHLQDGETLHPVQAALVECHASQCGFCTPGFVMSLFALGKNLHMVQNRMSLKTEIERYLGGNLCRCTGYRPILDAARQLYVSALPDEEKAAESDIGVADKFERAANSTIEKLNAIEYTCDINDFFRPRDINELCELRAQYPDARVVAGGTDIALDLTQRLERFDKVICIQQMTDLNYLTKDQDQFYIGSGCTIAKLVSCLQPLGDDLANLLHRFGATQIRNQATVGGSIANASPIGDLAPVFISMGATLVLQSIDGRRSMPIEEKCIRSVNE